METRHSTVMLYTILKPDELRERLRQIFPDVRISEFGPSCWIFSTTHLSEETSTEFVRLREVDGMYGGISQTTWKTVEEQETVKPRVSRLRTEYRAKEEQWEHAHYWSTEHIAYQETSTLRLK